jgi:hypothetical protein
MLVNLIYVSCLFLFEFTYYSLLMIRFPVSLTIEVLNVLSFLAIGELFRYSQEVVLDILGTFIKCISAIYVIQLVLNHTLFIHHLIINVKFLSVDI